MRPGKQGKLILKFLLEYSCFTMLCQLLLHSRMNQLFLFGGSFPFRSPQSIEQSSPSYTVCSHQLPILHIVSVRFSSVAHLCWTLCDPLDCSKPGFPIHHQLLELAQTHVHRLSEAIQLSHPLPSLSPLPSVSPGIRVFANKSVLRIRWPKYWSFSFSICPSNEYSGLISFKID